MINIIDYDLAEYEAIWQQQKELVEQRHEGSISDTILMGEHHPVITLGRGTKKENLLNPDEVPVIETERGGDVTYHGPGQLVAYPIIKLEAEQRDLHLYLRNLEEVLIQTLSQFGVNGFRNKGWTGVWVKDQNHQDRKIASIGVAVRKWVTWHGIALNVSTDLTQFQKINPCGLESHVMIALNDLIDAPVDMSMVKSTLVREFESIFVSNGMPQDSFVKYIMAI